MSKVTLDMIDKLIGKRVRDVYGRYIGYVAGLMVDGSSGSISIGVDCGDKGFCEFPSEHIRFEGDNVILSPSWRIDVERLTKERMILQRRIQAIEELFNEGELSIEEKDQLLKNYRERIVELQKKIEQLKAFAEKRVSELDAQKKRLRDFLVNLKVQYKSGEISVEAFKGSSQFISLLLNRIEQERQDILNIGSSLESFTSEQSVYEVSDMKPSDKEQMEDSSWLTRILKK
ncbi:MAG: CdvA-like protein [Nitrososphaerales archaeon]|nr:CdvA-like protein [Nitrososphaerales archaeon]